jgi:hypothetical protein
MPGKNRTPKDHRFAVEDLLDLYTRGHNSNGAGAKRKTTGRQKAGAENPRRASASRGQGNNRPQPGLGESNSTCGADGEGTHE